MMGYEANGSGVLHLETFPTYLDWHLESPEVPKNIFVFIAERFWTTSASSNCVSRA